MIDREEVQILFEEYDEEDPEKRNEYIMEQLINGTDLWFVNISLDNTLYLDYNFKNKMGSFSVGITKILDNSVMFKFNGVILNEEF